MRTLQSARASSVAAARRQFASASADRVSELEPSAAAARRSPRQRNQSLVREITKVAPRGIARELLQILADARNDVDVGFLHIEEQRPCDRIAPLGDASNSGTTPSMTRALNLVFVLLEEAVAEDAELADGFASSFCTMRLSFSPASMYSPSSRSGCRRRCVLVLGQRRDGRERLAAAFHRELDERVARARGRRRPEHLDLDRPAATVHIGPTLDTDSARACSAPEGSGTFFASAR